MKVLFLTNLPSPYRRDFFGEFGKLVDLTVLYERKSSSVRDKKWKSERIDTYREVFLSAKEIGEDNSFSMEIIHFLRNNKFDKYIIGMYSTYTEMIAQLYFKVNKIPYIISTDGGFIPQKESDVRRRLKTFLIGGASYWLSTGESSNSYLKYYGAQAGRISVYPFTSLSEKDLVVDNLVRKNKDSIKEKLGISEEVMVLSVGRFSYENGYGKGYDTLVKVAEKFDKTVGFYIVGDNPTSEFLELKEKKKLTNLHYVGFKTKKELLEYYASADVFTLLTRKDVWGLVINEAMSFSLPIVTTYECNAGLEMVRNDTNGYLVEAGDVETTYHYIKRLVQSDELRTRFGEKSFEIVQKYTIEEMAKCHFNILNDMEKEVYE